MGCSVGLCARPLTWMSKIARAVSEVFLQSCLSGVYVFLISIQTEQIKMLELNSISCRMQFLDLLHKRCCVFLFLHCIWFLTPAFVIGIGHTCNWLILIQCLVCQFEKVSNTVYHILYTSYIYQKKYHTTPVKSIFLTASLTVSVFVMISSESSVREVIYGRYLLRITNAYVMVCVLEI